MGTLASEPAPGQGQGQEVGVEAQGEEQVEEPLLREVRMHKATQHEMALQRPQQRKTMTPTCRIHSMLSRINNQA
jgi:hypothetical protein